MEQSVFSYKNTFTRVLISYLTILKSNTGTYHFTIVDCVWNVMAQAQKPNFVFRRNGRVHLNRWGASVHSTTGSRAVRISGSNTGYTMFRDSVKSTGYPLHSPVSPSLSLSCVTVCHHISTWLYIRLSVTLTHNSVKTWNGTIECALCVRIVILEPIGVSVNLMCSKKVNNSVKMAQIRAETRRSLKVIRLQKNVNHISS
jgi:hypothetical protein